MVSKGSKKMKTVSSVAEATVADGYHVPVLLAECLEAMEIKPDGIYVDCTFGGGGHSRAILERLGSEGRLVAIDQDEDAKANLPANDPRLLFVAGNFRFLPQYLRYLGIEKVDGILADLGVSSHHFDDPERGFSFRFDAPLDMRMNQEQSQTAATMIEEKSLEDLQDLFRQYGELRQAHAIAKALKDTLAAGQEIKTVSQFVDAISRCVRPDDKKTLAKVFQALRISLNGEMSALEALLEASVDLLRSGGKLLVITYHSLEDRPTKNFLRTGNLQGKRVVDAYGKLLSPIQAQPSKAIKPSEEELVRNPRSRSAKLRVGVRLEEV